MASSKQLRKQKRKIKPLWQTPDESFDFGKWRKSLARPNKLSKSQKEKRRRVEIKKQSPPSTWVNYYKYIQSKDWLKGPRKRAMRHAGGICERCKQREAVNVHHLTYERLGQERLTDLEALCRICHDKAHSIDLNREWRMRVEREP